MTRSRVLLPKFWGYEGRSEVSSGGAVPPIFAFCFIGQPTTAKVQFSNVCLTFIVGQKTLKFVAISAGPRRNCGQAL
jgi:hypothetical protein